MRLPEHLPPTPGRSDAAAAAAAAAEGDSAHRDRSTGTRAGGCPAPAAGPPNTNKKRRMGGCHRPRPGLRLPPRPSLRTGTPNPARPRAGRGAPSRKLTPRAGWAPRGAPGRSPRGKAAARCLRPAAPESPRFPAPRPRAQDAARASPGAPRAAHRDRWVTLRRRSLARTSETQREEGGALPRTARAARHRAAPAFRPRRRAAPGQVTRSPW